MKTKMTIAIVCAAFTGSAMADTFDAQYTGIAGGNNAMHLRVANQTYYAGHMNHTFTSGARAGESFSTFCIDFSETAKQQNTTYQIVDVADAPMPGTPYGEVIAGRINAVIANAVVMGWIDNRLQADTNQADYLAKMGAIQAALWEAFGSDVQLSSSSTSNALSGYYSVLTNENTYDDSLRIHGLKAMVAEGQQDMLYVVPLPPAAFAGLGMLGAIAGVRTVRRRK